MVLVTIEGVDGCGKSTVIEALGSKKYPSFKFPFDSRIKKQIIEYYDYLHSEEGKQFHPYISSKIYEQIHDLFDMDFRMMREQIQMEQIGMHENILLLDRYFISNLVYSKLHGVRKLIYEEEHLIPDLVILLRVRDYSFYKRKLLERSMEEREYSNIIPDEKPDKLFKQHQPLYIQEVKELKQKKLIKNYVIVDALRETTMNEIYQALSVFDSSIEIPQKILN